MPIIMESVNDSSTSDNVLQVREVYSFSPTKISTSHVRHTQEDASCEESEEEATKAGYMMYSFSRAEEDKPLEVEDNTDPSEKNAGMQQYDYVCTWLERTVEQYHVEERKKVEAVSNNLELELELISINQQLEEDRNVAECLLMLERKDSQRMQRELEEENTRNFNRFNEAMAMLREASDRESELLERNRSLQDEVMRLELELEQERANKQQGTNGQPEPNEALMERLEDVKTDLRLSEETLALTVSQYGDQISALKDKLKSTNERLSHLEEEKEELFSQVETERNKLKTLDRRLVDEVKRNDELQATMSEMKSNVDNLCQQVEKEALKSSRLKAENRELEEQLSPLKTLKKHYEKAKKSNKKLEEEVKSLKGQLETCRLDQEQAQNELQKKMEEVNHFLYTQAASQESRERVRAANEASVRTCLEQRIADLERELGQARNSKQDILSQRDCARTEMECYRNLYNEERRLRNSLAAKLERASERLEEASIRHQRSIQLLTNSIFSSSNIH